MLASSPQFKVASGHAQSAINLLHGRPGLENKFHNKKMPLPCLAGNPVLPESQDADIKPAVVTKTL